MELSPDLVVLIFDFAFTVSMAIIALMVAVVASRISVDILNTVT